MRIQEQGGQSKFIQIKQIRLLNLKLFSSGYEGSEYLIYIFKSRQDGQYYDLANLLEQYQMWTKNHLSYIYNVYPNKNVFNKTLQKKIDSVFPQFEQLVKVWPNETFPNELFEIEMGTVRFELAKPVLIKKIFSQNLMMLLGGEVYEIYQNLIQYNLKETLSSFLEGGEYNGRIQLEKILILIKSFQDKGFDESIFEDEIFTLDGISILVKKKLNTYYYESRKKQQLKSQICISFLQPSKILNLIGQNIQQKQGSNFQDTKILDQLLFKIIKKKYFV